MLVSYIDENGVNTKVESICYTEKEKENKQRSDIGLVFYRNDEYVKSVILTETERELFIEGKISVAKDLSYLLEVHNSEVWVWTLSLHGKNEIKGKVEYFNMPRNLIIKALAEPTPAECLLIRRKAEELVPDIIEKAFEKTLDNTFLKKQTIKEIKKRISYGLRVERAAHNCHVISWSNATASWLISYPIIKEGTELKLDANEVLFYGTTEQFEKIRTELPALPLYLISCECRGAASS